MTAPSGKLSDVPVTSALDRRSRRPEPAFDRLLAAGRELFAAEGYAATTLDAIAERAGVTKGSLYHHFKGKRELFEAVFEEESRALGEATRQALEAQDDAWAAIDAGLRTFLERSEDPAVHRIMLQEAPGLLGWRRAREVDEAYGLAVVRGAIDRLAAAGELTLADPETVAHLLFAVLIESALLLQARGGGERERARVAAQVRALVAGLAAS